MGGKYHVEIWVEVDGEYRYETVYYENSLFGAIRAYLKNRKYTGCTRVWIR